MARQDAKGETTAGMHVPGLRRVPQLSAPDIAAAIVFVSGRYDVIFLISIPALCPETYF